MSKKNRKSNWKSQCEPVSPELKNNLQHALHHAKELTTRISAYPCAPGVQLLLDVSKFGELACDAVHTEHDEENGFRMADDILAVFENQPVAESVVALLSVIHRLNADDAFEENSDVDISATVN
jgi:hypothetical protein